MGVAVAAQLALFIELKSVPRLTVAAAIATWAGRYGEMWEYLYAKSVPSELPPDKPRSEKRVLVIGPGFGQGSPDLLARQKMVQLRGVGFVLMSIFPSDPKRLDHNFAAGVAECEAALISFKPHAVISGSRGGMYLMELWRLLDEAGGDLHGWNGASVMLNAHPSCVALPKRAPVIVVHSSGDTVFFRSRRDVESMVKAAGWSSACMYFTAGSAGATGATPAKVADNHSEMQSLLENSLLPRLVDAVIDVAPNGAALGVNSEFNLHRSWRLLLSPARRAAEEALGFTPHAWVNRHWVSYGRGPPKLFEVAAGSAEFEAVSAVFASDLARPPYYRPAIVDKPWSQVPRLRSIQRVENRGQEGLAAHMEESIEDTLREADLGFTGGVHSQWLFHGAASDVLEGIVRNPKYGLDSNMCNGGVFWGNDIYFARDAPYSDHDEWATPGPDGTKRILLALVITGMSCLGKTGMQLARQLRNVAGHITYDSLVDDLSSLEIFVVKDAHICPAYIIQYTS